MKFLNYGLVLCAAAVAGCGGETTGANNNNNNQSVGCRVDNCGQSNFRAAVIGRSNVRIASVRSGSALTARSSAALAAESPRLLQLEAYVAGLNEDIASIFGHIEDLASDAPDVEDAAEHEWREADGALEELLEIETLDEKTFVLAYAVGPVGFEPEDVDVIVSGTVVVAADESKSSFELVVDLAAYAAASPGEEATGEISIRGTPNGQGGWELWYDLDQVSEGGEAPVSGRTTYWAITAEQHALEYVADEEGDEATLYARWDAEGGRIDMHVATEDAEGALDWVHSNCWGAAGEELFTAEALFDDQGALEAELDGEESACVFAPLADHPAPSDEFDVLPGEGQWSALEDDG